MIHIFIIELLDRIHPGGRHGMVIDRIDLARLVKVQHRRLFFKRVKGDPIKTDHFSVPVVRVFFHNDPVIWMVLFQLERAAGDDILRLGPILAVFFYRPH